MPTVAYASFLCPKDIERGLPKYPEHLKSHNYDFDEKFLVLQRCESPTQRNQEYHILRIDENQYKEILNSVSIPYPDEVYSELTHGFGGPHFYAHHLVNHIFAAQHVKSDYIVFSDGDCYVKDQPEGKSWINEGIGILESNPEIFVVSPSDGRPNAGRDSMMSQQMFLVNTKQIREMEYIPWDGKFIDGGPFREFYALWEGFCYRYMKKNNRFRYLLGPEFRWWHLEWH